MGLLPIEQHIADLARNILEQAAQRAREGLREDLTAVWKDATLKAAQVHLKAYGEHEGPDT